MTDTRGDPAPKPTSVDLPPPTYAHPLDATAAQRASLVRIVRVGFVVLSLTITVLAALGVSPGGSVEFPDWPLYVGVGIAIIAITFAIDFFTPKKKISTISAVFFGLMVAMLASVAFGFVIDLIAQLFDIQKPDGSPAPIISSVKVLVGIGLAYLTITTVMQTQDDFRLVIPYVEFAKQVRGAKPLLLDTSALIDARIVDVAGTRILQSSLVIPRFVIAELQQLADSHDKLRRTKGRRGLEMVTKLQRQGTADVVIDDMPVPGVSVDQMLVELARRMPALIVTNDVGLARVADIGGVDVININDLANALKPALVPGEQLSLMLIKPGEQREQAVGYLEDGTMVVAEDGFPFLNQRVTLVVTSTLQTSAGRLIFGRMTGNGLDAKPINADRADPSSQTDAPLPADPEPIATPSQEPSTHPRTDISPAPATGPLPPNPPRSLRTGTPRNPRR